MILKLRKNGKFIQVTRELIRKPVKNEKLNQQCQLILLLLKILIDTRIGGATCHPIHNYAKTNNKYMANYNKDIKSSYLIHLDVNNLYGLGMSQILPVNGFKWKKISKFDEDFLKNYDEDSDKGYILEVDAEYPNNVFNLHGDLPFLLESKKTKKCNKFVCDIHGKENGVVHIRALKQALIHGLILKKYIE